MPYRVCDYLGAAALFQICTKTIMDLFKTDRVSSIKEKLLRNNYSEAYRFTRLLLCTVNHQSEHLL